MNKLKLGSLFDGIGGFPLSAQRHGIEPVWASEIEPFPIKVTQHHFPNMKHLGDITQINGAEIEPVDIITFGSPCQDLSVAGKREGLQGERSGLFMDAVRIIREMRRASGGEYPRFIVWENVPGAFSSNKGEDFRAVLSEITEAEIPMPTSGKWAEAGMVRTERIDIAWRTLDAQYWGVPQRRRRIFLVADFGGQCAAEILFKPEGLRRNIAESREAGEEIAGAVGDSTAKSIGVDLYNWAESSDIAVSLNATSGCSANHAGPSVMVSGIIPFDTTQITSPQNGSNPKPDDPCHPLCANAHVPSIAIPKGYRMTTFGNAEPQLYDMTHAEEVMRPVEKGLAPTLNARMGTEGNQVPIVMREVSRTLRAEAGAPKHEADWESLIIESQIAYPDPAHSLLAKANMSFRDDVDTVVAVDCRNLCENEELSGTIQAKENGGYSLNYQNPVRVGYAVRRLTPTECERLMGFPDGWTDIPGASDTARYKSLGNSVARPCVDFVMSRIAEVLRTK